MRFAVGDSGTFLDAVKGGLFGAAFDKGLGGGALGATGAWNPTKGLVGTAFDKGLGGGALGATGAWNPTKGLVGTAFDKGLGGGALGVAGLYDPMKGVLGTDSAFADFIKRGGALGAAGVYDPMKGVLDNFGGGLGAIGGLFGKGGDSSNSDVLSGLGGISPGGFLGSFLG